MIVLYDRSAAFDALVAGTSNKTEALLGYGTLHGDMAAAFAPIGDLYKTQLRSVAAELGVPRQILDKPPSADLWPGQTDEGELGRTYDRWTAPCSRSSTGAGPSTDASVPASTATWSSGSRGVWRAWSSSASRRPSPRSPSHAGHRPPLSATASGLAAAGQTGSGGVKAAPVKVESRLP